ncbi:LLM class flavin-dependent oxidoreductase [Enemella evansiae]|uniref:LLM class flavin-dependent oxidoreductase n=1 Tax=Enemella evansiae TaxID=2016499 RepID=UPI000B978F6C|nr:LLM class flavin-dependent oxidoreductase [Enemella evansiae]OYO16371.1 LLM class flavin-dependent oxidoreductase [Enemella evansiae]
MRVGVCILPEYAWVEAAPRWRAVEELGFDHGWTYDHLVWSGLPDAPWHSTVVTLTAAATVTDRIPLGTWVASPNFRHPVPFARDLVSLTDVAGPGRVICAIGSGGDTDAELLGEQLSRGERTRRFGEFVGLLRRALVEDPLNYSGPRYTVHGYRNLAGAAAEPPRVVVAATGPRGMRLAIEQGDGWATTGIGGDDNEAWWQGVRQLTEALAEAGGRSLDRYLSIDAGPEFSLQSKEFCLDQLGRAAELGFTDVVLHWPRPTDPYRGSEQVLEAVAAELPRLH